MARTSVLEDKRFSYLLKPPSIFSRLGKKVFDLYCKIILTIYTPITVIGRDKIPDTSYIMCSNHNSHMDAALLVAASGKGFSHFGMLAAVDYWFYNRFRQAFANILVNLIPIDRKKRAEQQLVTLQDTIALCRGFMELNNRSFIIFPEGTRGTTNEIKSFKKGAATFAMQLNIPLVPIYIHGSHKAWPKGKLFIRPSRIKIAVGDPIYPNKYLTEQSESTDNPKLDVQAVIQLTKDLEASVRNMGKRYNV